MIIINSVIWIFSKNVSDLRLSGSNTHPEWMIQQENNSILAELKLVSFENRKGTEKESVLEQRTYFSSGQLMTWK